MLPIMIFFLGGLVLAAISWRTFSNPRSHGFFRFLAFEVLWGLIVVNAPAWFRNVLSINQILSWILLTSSLLLALHSFSILRTQGKPRRQPGSSTNFTFEQTTALVANGAYAYVRHPMYTSLMLLGWGTALKTVSFWSVLFAIIATGLLFVTARAEEFENLERFGEEYDRYMNTTRMFLPGIY